MKICITSKDAFLGSEIAKNFDSCTYFIFVEANKLGFEAYLNINKDNSIENIIKSAQFISEQKADVLITGNMEQKAYDFISNAGIMIITGVSGIIKDAINKFKKNELKPADKYTVDLSFCINLQN